MKCSTEYNSHLYSNIHIVISVLFSSLLLPTGKMEWSSATRIRYIAIYWTSIPPIDSPYTGRASHDKYNDDHTFTFRNN